MYQQILTSRIGFSLLIIAALLATILFPPELLGDDQFLTLPTLTLPTLPSEPDNISSGNITFPQPETITAESIINPDQTNYWIVSSRKLDQNDMLAGLSKRLEYFQSSGNNQLQQVNRQSYLQSINPDIPICIIIHGSFTTWQSIKTNSSQIVKWLSAAAPSRPMQYIFYTWPSETKIPLVPRIQVLRLGRKASINGFYLAQHICELPGASQMTLICHSHGARIASSALHLLGNGVVEGMRYATVRDNKRPIRAVFLAAAIDHHWLNPGKRFNRAIHRADAILVLVNKDDWALSLYPFRRIFSNRALSKTGFTSRDKNELGYLTHKLYELDVTEQISRGHFLIKYVENRSIACSIAPFVNYVDREELHTPFPTMKIESHAATSSK